MLTIPKSESSFPIYRAMESQSSWINPFFPILFVSNIESLNMLATASENWLTRILVMENPSLHHASTLGPHVDPR